MGVRIINADVMEGLGQLADESVHCVVTSPPYWGLRDYGVEGQIGLEATPSDFVGRMVEVFAEVRRVLRNDGTCWVNFGDSYASDTKGSGGTEKNLHSKRVTSYINTAQKSEVRRVQHGLKQKDLVGIPWRVAFALQSGGWWLRSDIIWHKPNPMPESVTDRPTKSHEYVFLLTKAERYYYDAEAIKTPVSAKTLTVNTTPRKGSGIESTGEKLNKWMEENGGRYHPELCNRRSVWTIATSPFPEAHFATFPPELPEICIKAGCPKGGTVLDPFAGAGTTCLVADRLQRNAIGIELNPQYAAMAEKRLNRDRGGLLDIMEAAE